MAKGEAEENICTQIFLKSCMVVTYFKGELIEPNCGKYKNLSIL